MSVKQPSVNWGGYRPGAGRKIMTPEERAERAAIRANNSAATADEIAIRIMNVCMRTGESPLAVVHDVMARVKALTASLTRPSNQ